MAAEELSGGEVCCGCCADFLFGAAGVGDQSAGLHQRVEMSQRVDDAADLLRASRRGVNVGRAQARAQQMLAGEDVQRQIDVLVVVAVKEAPFLVAMQRQMRVDVAAARAALTD